ncbi:putative gamma-butyrolactone biosynthesis protein [Actinacidiphila reveromycinica]|uniref:Putative gamma-butyrolactone biosynthesis protein n=1 Tax=Actinacidiphila reveromycinica TaxID=659352 RepID=A0A7U3USH1_9ACTN|nr:ScbA/BarX family gamma-butyrolactone biosynthesis protein [Streptomyces sp. SN-593]BBA97972.1 putative gamma-butyrolactone biosynthesis protein [Streptomyces sp. SN-593]
MPGLSWSRTVAREWVHRSSVAEVLLTDVRPDRTGGFEAAACWPRSHPTFPRDGSDLHSPLLVVETLRQLGIYLPLRFLGVPQSARLLIGDLYFALSPGREPRAGHGATEVTCAIAVSRVRRDALGAVTGLRLEVHYACGGHRFARAGGGARFVDPDGYAAVRGRHGTPVPAPWSPPPPAHTHAADDRPSPAALAVGGAGDVLITRRAGTLAVEPADPRHPFFFDHASDHVPGMVLLEAARQAAAEASGGTLLRPLTGRMVARRFTEFTPPALIEPVPHDRTCVFRVRQGPACTAYGVLGYDRHAV